MTDRSPRRRAIPFALGALLAIGLVSPAAAGKPDSFPQEEIVQDFTACGFPIHLEDQFAAGKILVFPTDGAGNTKLISAGGFKSTLTSGDKSIDVKFFGHIDITALPNGNQFARQGGNALWWFDTPEDAGMFGLTPGVYIFTGRVEVLLDADSVAIAPALMHAQVRNLCTELAPDA